LSRAASASDTDRPPLGVSADIRTVDVSSPRKSWIREQSGDGW